MAANKPPLIPPIEEDPEPGFGPDAIALLLRYYHPKIWARFVAAYDHQQRRDMVNRIGNRVVQYTAQLYRAAYARDR